jgi:hypothetical protein
MFRFLILLLGMLTTRAGKLEAGSFGPQDEDDWEEPGPWLEGPGYAADDTWIVARDPLPQARDGAWSRAGSSGPRSWRWRPWCSARRSRSRCW